MHRQSSTNKKTQGFLLYHCCYVVYEVGLAVDFSSIFALPGKRIRAAGRYTKLLENVKNSEFRFCAECENKCMGILFANIWRTGF